MRGIRSPAVERNILHPAGLRRSTFYREEMRGLRGPVRLLRAATAMLGLSVLADSAMEHYRGSFENPGMFAPLLASAATVLTSLRRPAEPPSPLSRRVFRTAVGVGVAGTGFHVFNVLRRPGGLSWQNLFYAAPLGAPAALALAGLFGLAADDVAGTLPGMAPEIGGMPARTTLAALASIGLAGTVAEAGLLHFRGAFHNPLMLLPVTLPPVAGLALAGAARSQRPDPGARGLLVATALLGPVGTALHAFGVSRAMGGWRNWSQNVLDGPPLPAPPAFSALALVGLAVLQLIEAEFRRRP
jgi:hypothetical protein